MKANVQYADAPQASLGCHINDASDEVTQQMYKHITSNATKSKTKKNLNRKYILRHCYKHKTDTSITMTIVNVYIIEVVVETTELLIRAMCIVHFVIVFIVDVVIKVL